MPIPDPIPGSRWSMRVLRNAPGPLFLLMFFGGVMLAVGFFLDDNADTVEPKWWLRVVGGWMLGGGAALTVVVPFAAMFFAVREAAAGSPHLCVIDRPTMPEKAEAQLEALENGSHGLAELGFEHVGWFRLDDFDETHVSAWRHAAHGAVAFVQYLPITAACKLRIVRWFPDGWVLVSSTRLTDLSYPSATPAYVQVRSGATAAELWAWHREAEELFPPRSGRREVERSPLDMYTGLLQRVARRHQRAWLWFVRYDPFAELWRMWRRDGVSVRQQLDRGWVTDPAMTFPDAADD